MLFCESPDRSQSDFDLIKVCSHFCRHSIQSKPKLRSPLSRSLKCISSDNVIVNGKWRFPHQKQLFVLSLVVTFQRQLENNHFSSMDDESNTDSLDLDSAENIRIQLHLLVIKASVWNLWDTTIRQSALFYCCPLLSCWSLYSQLIILLLLTVLLRCCRLYRLFSTPSPLWCGLIDCSSEHFHEITVAKVLSPPTIWIEKSGA